MIIFRQKGRKDIELQKFSLEVKRNGKISKIETAKIPSAIVHLYNG
jgi:hypothetical protein